MSFVTLTVMKSEAGMVSLGVVSPPFITGTPPFCSSPPFARILSWSPLFAKYFNFQFRRTSPLRGEVKILDFLFLDICCSPDYLISKMGSLAPQLKTVVEI